MDGSTQRGEMLAERFSVNQIDGTDRPLELQLPIYPGQSNDLLIYSFFIGTGRYFPENPAESADDAARSRGEREGGNVLS